MAIPENIGFNHIYPAFLGCLNKTRPHLPQTQDLSENCEVPHGRNKEGVQCHRRNASRVMNGSRDKKLALAIDDEGTTIVADIATRGHCDCEQQHRPK